MDPERKQGWAVYGWSRWLPDSPEPETIKVTDTEGRPMMLVEAPDPAYREDGAEVADRGSGVIYRATIGREGRGVYLTSLQIEAPEGMRITSRLLASIPAARIAEAVAQYLDTKAKAAPGDLVILPPAAVRGSRGFVPDLDELAARYDAIGRADVVADYGAEYEVSRATVDRWIRMAREAGLITKPIPPGRPRKETRGDDLAQTIRENYKQKHRGKTP